MSLFKYLPKLNQNTTVVLVLVATVFVFFPHITYASTIGSILWTLVNALFGWMVWVGGMMLNYSINEFVIGFGQMYQSSGLGNTIDSLWVIVRDIFNLTFIFGLVLIGLKMIFNSSDSNTKKMLVSLILAALLVNFSLFITKFVVDFANIASVQLVNAFPPNTSTVPSLSGKPDVAGEFMKLMGVSGLLNWGNNAGFSPTGNTYGGSDFGYILGTMILYVVTAFVFLAGGLLLMIRFVVLSLYLVLSPLIFLGWVFPAAAGLSKQYWSGFLGQAFFAPAYILMLYFAQKILSTFNVTAGGGKTLSSMFSNNANTNFADVFPPFILTAIFLVAALVIAKKMGATGATAAVSFGQSMANKARGSVQRAAGGAVFGSAARVGQSVVGGSARRLTQSNKVNEWASKYKPAKYALKAAHYTADSSFDARRVGGLGKTFGIGEGLKGGITTRVKAKQKSDEEFTKLLAETQVYSKDASGNKVYATKEIEAEFLKLQQSRLSTNTDYQKATTNTAQKQTAQQAADAALVAKKAEKTQLETDLAQLKQDVANNSYDVTKKAELAQKTKDLADVDKSITSLQADATKTDAALKAALKTQEDIFNTITASVESSIKYRNQLAYIEKIEKKGKFYGDSDTQAVGGIASYTGGVATAGSLAIGATSSLGIGIGVGAIAYGALDNIAYANQESATNLRKLYGADGTGMDKKKKEKDSTQKIVDLLKDSGSLPEATPPAPAAST